MMLITCDVCYLIDRKFFFQRINMRFPCRYTNGVCMFIQFTLVAKWVSWVSGSRVLAFVNFILDSLMDKSIVFNHNHFKGTPERNHHYTLLDGEMIIDTDPHTHKQERRYLIYDLMAINQVSLTEVHIY